MAIKSGLVNPKNRRRPTMTPKEMTTLLAKAEGQYLMIYFLSLVTGMRISETVATEIDNHIEPDRSIIYVRQQREKDVNALKPHLKTEAGLRDIDLHPTAARISWKLHREPEEGLSIPDR